MSGYFENLKNLCEENGIYLDALAKERFETYKSMLIEANKSVNLTAITEPGEIYIKHFFDSLLFFKAAKVDKNAKIIDVGTGAGFPGLVLKIARPDIKLTLLDGLNKRLIFLENVLLKLGLEAEIRHMRAEEGGKDKKLRESFDFATARAVKNLPVLCEYCLPYVKLCGNFIALKGASGEEELEIAANAIKLLGGKTESVLRENLPGGDKRVIINIKKISQTSPKFPRDNAKISKKPL